MKTYRCSNCGYKTKKDKRPDKCNYCGKNTMHEEEEIEDILKEA
ncbi:MAG: hypothetical protein QXX68_01460 [Candidatus Pacearchaeota archaeon]